MGAKSWGTFTGEHNICSTVTFGDAVGTSCNDAISYHDLIGVAYMDSISVWAVGRRSYVKVSECQVVGVSNFYVDSFAIHQLYSFENSIAHVRKPNGLHHAKKLVKELI